MRTDACVATVRAEGVILVGDTPVRLALLHEFVHGGESLVEHRVCLLEAAHSVLSRVRPPPLPRPSRESEHVRQLEALERLLHVRTEVRRDAYIELMKEMCQKSDGSPGPTRFTADEIDGPMGPMLLRLHTVCCEETGTTTRSGGGARALSASTAPYVAAQVMSPPPRLALPAPPVLGS